MSGCSFDGYTTIGAGKDWVHPRAESAAPTLHLNSGGGKIKANLARIVLWPKRGSPLQVLSGSTHSVGKLSGSAHLMNTSTFLRWTSLIRTSSRSWHFIPLTSGQRSLFSNRSSHVMEEVKRTLTAEASPLNLPHRSAQPLGLWSCQLLTRPMA